jgi:hypothetical protein
MVRGCDGHFRPLVVTHRPVEFSSPQSSLQRMAFAQMTYPESLRACVRPRPRGSLAKTPASILSVFTCTCAFHMHMRDRLAASLRKMCSLSAPQRDAIDALEADHIENGDEPPVIDSTTSRTEGNRELWTGFQRPPTWRRESWFLPQPRSMTETELIHVAYTIFKLSSCNRPILSVLRRFRL